MRPPAPHPAIVTVLLVAILLVLFADVLAVSAAADPLPASTSASTVLSPISPSSISRALHPQLASPIKPTARRGCRSAHHAPAQTGAYGSATASTKP